ncbi:MAG: conserved rane protein of unknown function [Blastococcus sp.]|nr:conserved rane protein of unknown function [Blastococcus sp.]
MAISVLDVRDTFATPHVTVPARAAVAAAAEAAPRRLPVTVVSAGLIGVLEAVGLLAVALTGLDGVLSSPSRPAGWIVAGGLLLLAAWIVLCAGSGAALIDGAGRKLLLGVTYAEMALVAMLMVIATATPVPTPGDIPAPALGLMALAVPVGKLLLAGAPSAQRWVAEGPRTRVRRVDPVRTHRLLATVTLAVIGLSLGAVAVLAPVQSGGPNDPASVVSSH